MQESWNNKSIDFKKFKVQKGNVFHLISYKFLHIVKVGRTHLQEAVLICSGQEFATYAKCASRGAERLSEMANGRNYFAPI